MSMRPTAWLVALALLNAGCSLVSDGAHVIGYRTRQALNDSREAHRNRKLAAGAWDEVRGRTPGLSEDFGDGFKEGFAEHLYRGTCEPPVLAPARYRAVRNQTPEGYRAAEEWFNGFRHGVAEARSRGLRELVTGPSALRSAAPPEPAPAPAVPLIPAPVPSVSVPAPPMPTPLPPPAALPLPTPQPAAPPAARAPISSGVNLEPVVRAPQPAKPIAAPVVTTSGAGPESAARASERVVPPVVSPPAQTEMAVESVSPPEAVPQSPPAPQIVAAPEVAPVPVIPAAVVSPPIRLTMQQVIQARVVMIVPADELLTERPAEPEPPPPAPSARASSEQGTNWVSSRSSDAGGAVIWWRSEGPDVRAATGDRVRNGVRGIVMSRAGSSFAGGP